MLIKGTEAQVAEEELADVAAEQGKVTVKKGQLSELLVQFTAYCYAYY